MRRDRLIWILGLTMVVGATLSACSTTRPPKTPSSSAKTPSSSPKTPSSSTSKLVIGSLSQPATLDPTSPSATPATDRIVDGNVLQHLVGLTPNGTLVPVLATSWQVDPAGKTYTFTLRPNVKFSNGDPLTVDDVVFSLNRARATIPPTLSEISSTWHRSKGSTRLMWP